MAEVVWAPLADKDLDRAWEWLSVRSPRAAQRLMASVVHAIEMLESDPEAGAVVGDLEPQGAYRHWVIPPFRLIYRLQGNRLEVLRFWDSRQGPAGLQSAIIDD